VKYRAVLSAKAHGLGEKQRLTIDVKTVDSSLRRARCVNDATMTVRMAGVEPLRDS